MPEHRRNFAFGLFYIGYGSGWLIGSISTGLLYQHSRLALIGFAVAVQLLSIPIFVLGARADRATSSVKTCTTATQKRPSGDRRPRIDCVVRYERVIVCALEVQR